MRGRILRGGVALLSCGLLMGIAGCKAPGKPEAAELRPDQVMEFDRLYKQNCAACHGEAGKGGLAVSLANPVYIAIAGKETIREYTANGGPGKLMPAFAKKSGGTLTDAQVEVLASGIVERWGKANALAGQGAPPYRSTLTGDPVAGEKEYASNCVRCHGSNGVDKNHVAGAVTDPMYLALISDQGLRVAMLAGRPEEGMPDWRRIAAAPLTDQQITDVVAWLGTLRHRPASSEMPKSTGQASQGGPQ